MDFNSRLDKLIKDKGVTPYVVSKKTGISQATLSRVLSRSTAKMCEKNIELLAQYFEVDVEWLRTGVGDMLRNIENISESNSNQEKDYLAIIKNQSDQISELIKQVAANVDRLDDLHRIIEFQRRELEELKAQKNASPAGDGKVAAAG